MATPPWWKHEISHARRRLAVLIGAGAWTAWALPGCGGGGGGATPAPPPAGSSVPSWRAAQSDLREDVRFLDIPPPATTAFQDQTLRQVARLSLGGTQVRIRFSNLYGQAPLPLARVEVALSAGPGAVEPATRTAVTFQGGSAAVSVPPGGEVWSDAVPLQVPDGAALSVSVYLRDAADALTAHRYANALQYVAPGDQASAPALPTGAAHQLLAWHWMSGIDVYRPATARVVVAFGDSLTDGNGSPLGADQRYPDLLAARFRQQSAADGGAAVAVVNAGLGGNRWLHDRFGLRGVERFRRDVLQVAGVTHAIVQLGINDIGFQLAWTPGERATAEQIIASLAGAVAAGKAAGVQVHLTTLMPFKGHPYFSAAGEQARQTVNAWIRANTEAAGVIDFDAAVRDPAEPDRLLAAYRDVDSLHLNGLGYARLAEVVPLDRFR